MNVVGPALLYQAYLPLLEKGKKKTVVNLSSGFGSVGMDLGSNYTSYSVSKNALNMLVSISYVPALRSPSRPLHLFCQNYKIAKERPDFIAIVLDPGWVKTGKHFRFEEQLRDS